MATLISIIIACYILSALFDSMVQVWQYSKVFFPISRLPLSWYRWDMKIRFPWPMDAPHTYHGLFVWLKVIGWLLTGFLLKIDILYVLGIFVISEIFWWSVLRNFVLHTVLTKGKRLFSHE